tara:strand:- start:7547 stop:7651 length:105 start_codon:yes stop_codon:yes gene_type:complete
METPVSLRYSIEQQNYHKKFLSAPLDKTKISPIY